MKEEEGGQCRKRRKNSEREVAKSRRMVIIVSPAHEADEKITESDNRNKWKLTMSVLERFVSEDKGEYHQSNRAMIDHQKYSRDQLKLK